MARRSSKGDTIIEVVLAMALLTSVLFIAWGITNRATQVMLAARDRTLMVNAVKEQAEIVKAQWAADTSYFSSATYPSSSSISNSNPCSTSPTDPNHWYLTVDIETGQVAPVVNESKAISGDATKLVWIEKVDTIVPSTPSAPEQRYSDFYVRACWQSQSGGSQRDENTQVLVRLNT